MVIFHSYVNVYQRVNHWKYDGHSTGQCHLYLSWGYGLIVTTMWFCEKKLGISMCLSQPNKFPNFVVVTTAINVKNHPTAPPSLTLFDHPESQHITVPRRCGSVLDHHLMSDAFLHIGTCGKIVRWVCARFQCLLSLVHALAGKISMLRHFPTSAELQRSCG